MLKGICTVQKGQRTKLRCPSCKWPSHALQSTVGPLPNDASPRSTVFAKRDAEAAGSTNWVWDILYFSHEHAKKPPYFTALPYYLSGKEFGTVWARRATAEGPGQALAAEGGAAVDACDERRVARRERGVEERQQHAVRIVEERQQCGVARRLLGQMRRGSTPWAAARRVGRQGCTAGARRR